MAKSKRKSRSKRRRKDSPLWQWVLVAVVAFVLFKGVDYYLPKEGDTPRPTQKPAPTKQNKEPASSSLSTSLATPIKGLSVEDTEKFLPKQAFPDNYQSRNLDKDNGMLLAYANTISGRAPGPKGLTNTRPGLKYLHWNGKKIEEQEISFKKLGAAMGSLTTGKLEGLPHLTKDPFKEGDTQIFSTRLFLKGDNREVMAYLKVDETGSDWATLHHPSGKKMPTAFVLGTTATTSRQIRHRKYAGRHYLIVENGILDEMKAYEGYQWTVQAYYWNKDHYEFDGEYSKTLTEAKKTKSLQ